SIRLSKAPPLAGLSFLLQRARDYRSNPQSPISIDPHKGGYLHSPQGVA
ncbi:MAG: hypothetical protein QOF94_2687, partial [Acidobacteriaceae bacterium]